MTWQSEFRAWAVAGAAVFALSGIGWKVWHFSAIPDLQPTVQRVNDTLDIVNRPCMSVDANHHLLKDGTMCQINEAIDDVRKIATTSQHQIAQTDILIRSASTSITGVATSAQGAIQTVQEQSIHIAPLLEASTNAINAFPVTLQHVDTTLEGLTPVLGTANATLSDFRAFINRPALAETADNVGQITTQWAAVSVDFRKVADKTTADYLRPVPWYEWPVKKSSDLLDIGAAVARHTP